VFSTPRALYVFALIGVVLFPSAEAHGDFRLFQADASADAGVDASLDGASNSDASNRDDANNDGPSNDVNDDIASDGAGTDAAISDANGADAAEDAHPDAPGIFQPGTQPNELTKQLRPARVCGDCHGQYAPEYEADSTWRGTMMANAARDPLFHAALTVARQDAPASGDLCIRCHAPRAWLFGRSEPALISNFEPDDFESVQCDFCHRLTTGPTNTPYIGNGQYFVADDFTRRGPILDAKAPHEFEYSSYFEESRLCGLCHDVSNPLKNGFAIERTYTEWATSAFATEGKNCQSCHMPSQRGFACGAPDMPERDVHRHELAGGNYWMPLVLAGEHREFNREPYEKTAEHAQAQLRSSADVTVDAPARAKPGDKIALKVRVENKTGHKLPTGYPEGRRMWLEVEVDDETGKPIFHSGAYDRATSTRATDPQLRTYEVRMAANGVEGFHFILQDEVLQDNRIPPRGFVPRPDTKPVGRDYPTVSSPDAGDAPDTGAPAALVNWDDAPYEIALPSALSGRVVIRATLWYQTTSREYVDALRTANSTDDYGQKMADIWERYDKAPPFSMATAMGSIDIESSAEPAPEAVVEPAPEPMPEAGVGRSEGGLVPEPSREAGLADSGVDASARGEENVEDGCSCSLAVARRTSYQAWFVVALGFIGLLGRSRARPREGDDSK
jgi:hypothetical protein